MVKSSSTEANCELCQNFRPQASFVDAWKRIDMNEPHKEMMQSLKEVRKAEIEALEHEVELLFEYVRADLQEWPDRPRLAPFCSVAGRAYIAAIKNRGGRCTDFQPARSRDSHGCHTCGFMTLPPRHIGDRHESLAGWMDEGTRNHVVQRNKDRADADAAAKGLEIEQAFYSESRLPVVQFLPTCAVKRKEGFLYVVPFCNLRHDCRDHAARLEIPRALLPVERDETSDQSALELCVSLARDVAAAGVAQPAAFVERLVERVAREPEALQIVDWCRRQLGRWANISNVDRTQLVQLESLSAPSRRLLPFIAGADALEWGWLAERSRTHPEVVAKVVTQQVAEFLAATIRPLDGIRVVDGVVRLVDSGIFSDTTRSSINTFMRRIRVHGEDLLHSLRTDLTLYYEAIAAKILYTTSYWLRLQNREGGALGDGLVMQQRDRNSYKIDRARREAEWLLSRLAELDNPNAEPSPTNFLEQVIQANDDALEFDVKEREDILRNVMASVGVEDTRQSEQLKQQFLSGMLGINLPTAPDISTQVIHQQFASIKHQELPARRLAAWLILRRGTLPVTPSAIEFNPNARPAQSVPTSIERALIEPASKNLEAYFPAPGADPVLARCRRIGAPRFV